MEFRLIFCAYLVLCAIAFIEVLFTIKKNLLLKVCFLLIISSLFVMNYFAYASVSNRLEFVLAKSMRVIYVSSTMLAIIQLVTPKIPRWIIAITALSVFLLIGFRIFYFNEIDIDTQALYSSQIFSVGGEFQSPIPVVRYTVLSLAAVGTALTFYYYRQFVLNMNREDIYYKQLSRWIISMVVPFFLLIVFGMLGTLYTYQQAVSSYLFSIFSCTIIFSILLRPKLLNTRSRLNDKS